MPQERQINNNNIYPAPNEPEEGEILAPCDNIQNKFDYSFNLNQKMNSTDCKIITYKNPFIAGSQSLGVLSNSGQIIKDQDFAESKNFQPAPFMGSYGQGSMFQTEDFNLDAQYKGYEKEYAQNEHEEPEPESVEDNQDKEFYENKQNKFYEENCDNSIAEEQEEELEVINDRQILKVPQPNFGHSGEEAELAEHESDQNMNGDDTVSQDKVPKSRPIGIDFGVMSPNAGLNNDMVHDYSENSQREQGDFINDSQSSPSCQSDNEFGLNNQNRQYNFYQQKPDDSDMEQQPFIKNESFQSLEKLDEDQKQIFGQDKIQKIEISEELDDEHKFKESQVPEFIQESEVTGSKKKPKKSKVIHEATRKSVRNCPSFQSKQNQKQDTESQFEIPEIVLEESVHDTDKEFQNLDSKTGRSMRSRKNIHYSEQKSFNKTPAAKGLTEKAKVFGNSLDQTSEKSDARIQTTKKNKQKEVQDFTDVLKEECNEEEVKQSASKRGGSSKKNKIVSERQASRRSKRTSLPEIQEEETLVEESANQSPEKKLKNSQGSPAKKIDRLSMTLQQQDQILEQADDKIPDVKLVSQRKSQIQETNNLSNSQNDENENNVSENQNIYELQNIEESDEEENLEPYWKQPMEDYEEEKENQESNDIDDESSLNPGTALPIVQLSSSESSNNQVDEEMSESAPNKYSEKQIDQSADKYNAFGGIDYNENYSKAEEESSDQVESEQSATGNKLGFRQIGPSKIQIGAQSSIDEDQSNDKQQQFLVKSSVSEEPTPNSSSILTLLDQEIIEQLQDEDMEEQDDQNQEDEVEDDEESAEDNQSKSEQETEEEQDSLNQDDQEMEERAESNVRKPQNSPMKQNNIEQNSFQKNKERQSTQSFQKLFSLQRGKAKSTEKLTENQEDDQKKRGRPKKDEIKQQQKIQILQDDQANKKRGRPKKLNEDQKMTDNNEQVLDSQEIKVEGKKRGRPSVSKDKTEEAKIQEILSENVISEVKEIKEEKKESTPKKRGRGKKQKDEEKQEIADEIKNEVENKSIKGKRWQKSKESIVNEIVDEPIKFIKQKSSENKGFGFTNFLKKNEVGLGEKLVSFGFGFAGPDSDRMESSSEQFELPQKKEKALPQSKKVKQILKGTDTDTQQVKSVSKGTDTVLQKVKSVSKGTGPDLQIQKTKSVSKGTDPVLQKVKQVSKGTDPDLQIQKIKSVNKGTDPDPKISFQFGFASPLKSTKDTQPASPSKVRTFNKVSQTQNNLSRSIAVQVASQSQTLDENKLQVQKPQHKIPQSKVSNKVEEQRPPSKVSQSRVNKIEVQKPPSKISQTTANVTQSKKSDLRSGLRSQQIESKEAKQQDINKVKSKEKKRKASPIQQTQLYQPQKPPKSSQKIPQKKVEEKHTFGLRSGPKVNKSPISKPSPQKRKRDQKQDLKQEEKKVNKTMNLEINKLETPQKSAQISVKKNEKKLNKNNDIYSKRLIRETVWEDFATKTLPRQSPQKVLKRSFSLRNKQEEESAKQPATMGYQKKAEKVKEQEVVQARKVQINFLKNGEIKEAKRQEFGGAKKAEKAEKVQKTEKALNLQKVLAEKLVKLEKLQKGEKVQKLEANIGKGNKKKQEIVEPEPEKPYKRKDKKEIEKESDRVTRNGRGRPSKKGSPIKAVLLSVQKENKVGFGLFEPKQLKEPKQSKEPKQLNDKSIKIKKTETLRVIKMDSALGFVTKEKRQPKYKM